MVKHRDLSKHSVNPYQRYFLGLVVECLAKMFIKGVEEDVFHRQ